MDTVKDIMAPIIIFIVVIFIGSLYFICYEHLPKKTYPRRNIINL